MNIETGRLAPASSDLFADLNSLAGSLGAGVSKHDLAIVLISACIERGINTAPHIIGVLRHLGLDRKHIAITLNSNAGNDPQGAYWWRTSDGVYHLYD